MMLLSACTSGLPVAEVGRRVSVEPLGVPDGYVLIEEGTFLMGSPADERWREDDEAAWSVTITRDFVIKTTEVTQEEWTRMMGFNPSHHDSCGPTCPVEMVSWFDALEYCNALSRSEGLTECYDLSECIGDVGGNFSCAEDLGFSLDCPGYRLPTEAEWEYSARAGTTTAFYNGNVAVHTGFDPLLDQIAWYDKNTGNEGVQRVGQKSPNAWGLHDTIGNLWEWTWDAAGPYEGLPNTDPTGPASGSQRALRGCSWANTPHGCRVARRHNNFATDRFEFMGFRPARTFTRQKKNPAKSVETSALYRTGRGRYTAR